MIPPIRCSSATARALGALPARMEGPVYRVPPRAFGIITEDGAIWVWPVEASLFVQVRLGPPEETPR
jgi:hypothetical protein